MAAGCSSGLRRLGKGVRGVGGGGGIGVGVGGLGWEGGIGVVGGGSGAGVKSVIPASELTCPTRQCMMSICSRF